MVCNVGFASDMGKIEDIKMMDQILPVVYMIGVLLLVLPAFLQSNSKLK